MLVTKCDICKKVIKDDDSAVTVGVGRLAWGRIQLCVKCGEPIRSFLEKNRLIETKK